MTLKTFNIDDDAYKEFSEYCKAHGLSMSKQVDTFIRAQIEKEPKARKEYLEKLDKIRKGKFIRVDSFSKRYGL